MDLDDALIEFREKIKDVKTQYKVGKLRKVLDEILNCEDIKNAKRSRPKIIKPIASLTARRCSPQHDIFDGTQTEDPFGYASQEIAEKIRVKTGEKSCEKQFCLMREKDPSKARIRVLKVQESDRLKKRRILKERNWYAPSIVKSHSLTSRQLVPASQEMLSQNQTIMKGENAETPRRTRRHQKLVKERRNSLLTPETNKSSTKEIASKSMINTNKKACENKENEKKFYDVNSQEVSNFYKKKKELRVLNKGLENNSSEDEVYIPRKKVLHGSIVHPKTSSMVAENISTRKNIPEIGKDKIVKPDSKNTTKGNKLCANIDEKRESVSENKENKKTDTESLFKNINDNKSLIRCAEKFSTSHKNNSVVVESGIAKGDLNNITRKKKLSFNIPQIPKSSSTKQEKTDVCKKQIVSNSVNEIDLIKQFSEALQLIKNQQKEIELMRTKVTELSIMKEKVDEFQEIKDDIKTVMGLVIGLSSERKDWESNIVEEIRKNGASLRETLIYQSRGLHENQTSDEQTNLVKPESLLGKRKHIETVEIVCPTNVFNPDTTDSRPNIMPNKVVDQSTSLVSLNIEQTQDENVGSESKRLKLSHELNPEKDFSDCGTDDTDIDEVDMVGEENGTLQNILLDTQPVKRNNIDNELEYLLQEAISDDDLELMKVNEARSELDSDESDSLFPISESDRLKRKPSMERSFEMDQVEENIFKGEMYDVMQSTRQQCPNQTLYNSKLTGINKGILNVAQSTPVRSRDNIENILDTAETGTVKHVQEKVKVDEVSVNMQIPGMWQQSSDGTKHSALNDKYEKYSMVVACSQLNVSQKKEIRKLCDRENGILLSSVNQFTTHLVTTTSVDRKPGEIFCHRTLKYFQALAYGTWIISFDWVELSVKLDDGLATEDIYEINGDTSVGKTFGARKSRLDHKENNKLFGNYAVWCQPPFSTLMPKPTLYNLLKAAHISIFEDVDDLKKVHKYGLKPLVLVNEKDINSQPLPLAITTKLTILERDWILDSLCYWDEQPFKKYIAV